MKFKTQIPHLHEFEENRIALVTSENQIALLAWIAAPFIPMSNQVRYLARRCMYSSSLFERKVWLFFGLLFPYTLVV